MISSSFEDFLPGMTRQFAISACLLIFTKDGNNSLKSPAPKYEAFCKFASTPTCLLYIHVACNMKIHIQAGQLFLQHHPTSAFRESSAFHPSYFTHTSTTNLNCRFAGSQHTDSSPT